MLNYNHIIHKNLSPMSFLLPGDSVESLLIESPESVDIVVVSVALRAWFGRINKRYGIH